MKIGDLVRYKDKVSSYKWSCWTGIVVEVFIPGWETIDIDYIKVIWNQDPSESGIIRSNLMEVISESR